MKDGKYFQINKKMFDALYTECNKLTTNGGLWAGLSACEGLGVFILAKGKR
jgi:hypothetical protein